MNTKYKFTGKTINHFSTELKQIQRLSDGLVGGYIEKEFNLSHEGSCFVSGNARVYGDARVLENAQVCGDALVYGDALVFENALVFGNARVYENARVCGDARVYGYAQVCGDAEVCGDAKVYGDARVWGNAEVSKSQDCINITGLRYNITLCPTFGHVGCRKFNPFELHDIKYEDYKDQISEEEFDEIKLIILTHYELMLSKQ